jgi:hypothetical protein
VPFFAGIPKRTGWRGEMRFGLLNDVRKLDKARYPLMIERFMALAYAPGAELPQPYPRPNLQIEAQSREAAMAKFGLALDRPVINQVVYEGMYTPTAQPVPPTNPLHVPGFQPEPRNLDRARALLREAGVRTPLAVEMTVPNSPDLRQAAEVMQANPSYIFFRPLEGLAPDEGPLGSFGVPLTPQRSVAVDVEHVPQGAPVFLAGEGHSPPRLAVAQDTGGAIRGPARADLFWGWGDEAGARAGGLNQPTRMFVLVPRRR